MSFYPTYGIQAEWGGAMESAAGIGRRVSEMAQGLTNLAPAKSHWRFVDGEDLSVVPLAEARTDIGGFLRRNIRDEGGQPDPDNGYSLVLIGSENDSETVAGNDLHVMAVVGSKWANSLRFQVGDIRRPNDFSLITYPLYRAALEVIASAWACPRGDGLCVREFLSIGAPLVGVRFRLDRLPFGAACPQFDCAD